MSSSWHSLSAVSTGVLAGVQAWTPSLTRVAKSAQWISRLWLSRPWGSTLAGVGLSMVLLSGCTPEQDARILTEEPPPDPCLDPAVNLSGGITNGDDLVVVFNCLNKDGKLEAYAPVVEAMAEAKISDGQTTVLDMWVTILQAQLAELDPSSLLTLDVADLVALLDQTLETLNAAWVDTGVLLVGDVLASGTVEPAVQVLSPIAGKLLTTPGGSASYLRDLSNLLCPSTSSDGRCSGDAQQLYAGLMALSQSYNPNDTSEYPLPDGATTARILASLFAPAGDDADANLRLNTGLAKGVARLGNTDFLQVTLGSSVPLLYGDNPTTDAPRDGYESGNVNRSALYAILNELRDPDYLEALSAMLNELTPLTASYYDFSLTAVGNAKAVPAVTCKTTNKDSWSSVSAFVEDNPAQFGLAQILRVLKGVNVSYRDNALCQATLEGALPIFVETYGLQLSGTTNIASLLLEIFSQMPIDDVIFATDASNLPQQLLDASLNSFCGTYIYEDDLEALQKSVHMPEVIEPTLQLLKLVTLAGKRAANESQGAGEGGMETVKDLIIGLYDSQMLCDAQPWLAAAITPGTPLADATGGLSSLLPGGKWHDPMLLPLLHVLISLEGDRADKLLTPLADGLAEGLTETQPPLAHMLTGLGKFGRQARLDAADGQTPALYQLNSLLQETAALDPNREGLTTLVKALEQQALIDGVLETLATPEVAEALAAIDPEGNAPIGKLSYFVNSGQLQGVLELVRSLLVTLNSAIDQQSSGEAARTAAP